MEIKYFLSKENKKVLEHIFIESINNDDIKKGVLTINIPSIIDGHKIVTIGQPSHGDFYSFIDMPHSLYNNLKEKVTYIKYNIKNGPLELLNLKIEQGFDIPIYLDIPSSIVTLGYKAFENIKFKHISCKYVQVCSNSVFYNCIFEENFIFPSRCKRIGAYAFYKVNFKKGFSFPRICSLTTISEFAFKNAKFNMDKLTFPKSVKFIYEYAFSNISNMDEIIFLDLLEIKHFAFSEAEIKKIMIKSEGDLTLEEKCFAKCYKLNEMNLSEAKIGVIPPGFCINNTDLVSLSLPKTCEIIQDSAFKNCNLITIVFPENIKKLDDKCFEDNHIQSLVFLGKASNLFCIGDYAFFNNCIEELPQDIFKNLAYCGEYAFAFNHLKELTLEASKHFIKLKGVFAKNKYLKKVTFLNNCFGSWLSLGPHVFENCYKLNEINAPKTIVSFDEYCLFKTGINKIHSDSVECIGKYAFAECEKLEVCDFSKAPIQKIENSVWENSKSLKTILLPPYIANIDEMTFSGVSKSIIEEIRKTSPFVLY